MNYFWSSDEELLHEIQELVTERHIKIVLSNVCVYKYIYLNYSNLK